MYLHMRVTIKLLGFWTWHPLPTTMTTAAAPTTNYLLLLFLLLLLLLLFRDAEIQGARNLLTILLAPPSPSECFFSNLIFGIQGLRFGGLRFWSLGICGFWGEQPFHLNRHA